MLQRKRAPIRPVLAVLAGVLLAVPLNAPWADSRNITVLYPALGDPYRQIFEAIISGIEENARGRVTREPLDRNASSGELERRLASAGTEVVIGLGRAGMETAIELNPTYPAVFGAVNITPDSGVALSGISLAPDAGVVFKRLRDLAPRVKRISIVYNPARSQWLVDNASAVAPSFGLELDARPAGDLRKSAAQYREILKNLSGPREAIWIPQDPTTVDQRTTLPMILTAAWDRDLVVFSTNPAHARRGALFSLFPDNRRMGGALAELAEKQTSASRLEKPVVLPLTALATAVNLRTAEHLDLTYSQEQKRSFDLVFPQP